MEQSDGDTQRQRVDVHVGVDMPQQQQQFLDDDPDLEEAATRMFVDMPPAPATLEEAYKRLMIRSLINKLSIMRIQRYFDNALALIRVTVARTDDRVAHNERQLEGVQRQLLELSTGQREILNIARNIDSTRSVESRFNGQLYQQLEERINEDVRVRKMHSDLIIAQHDVMLSWRRSGWAAVWAIVVGTLGLMLVAGLT